MSDTVNRSPSPKVDGRLVRLIQGLWPGRCMLCRGVGLAGMDLCANCLAALPWSREACSRCAIPLPRIPASGDFDCGQNMVCGRCLQRRSPLTAVHAAFVYDDPLDQLLPRLKFHRDLAAARLLAQLMFRRLQHATRPGALIALPLHTARLRTRGYDQALELARPLARAFGLPLLMRGLQRARPTAPQSRLDAAQRHRNLRGAFIVEPTHAWPAHVALVDDVMTTGATLESAARCLRRAGVSRVDAWVCARVP